jgi:hypothetical protein
MAKIEQDSGDFIKGKNHILSQCSFPGDIETAIDKVPLVSLLLLPRNDRKERCDGIQQMPPSSLPLLAHFHLRVNFRQVHFPCLLLRRTLEYWSLTVPGLMDRMEWSVFLPGWHCVELLVEGQYP